MRNKEYQYENNCNNSSCCWFYSINHYRIHSDDIMKEQKMKETEILKELEQFRGSEHYYNHPLGLIKYTDGIKFLADAAQCYWFIDVVASYQVEKKFSKESFLVFHLKVNDDLSAKITITDGNDSILGMQMLEYTDFPLKEIKVWCIDKILILPGEY